MAGCLADHHRIGTAKTDSAPEAPLPHANRPPRRTELQLDRAWSARHGQVLRIFGILPLRDAHQRRPDQHRDPFLQQDAAAGWHHRLLGCCRL